MPPSGVSRLSIFLLHIAFFLRFQRAELNNQNEKERINVFGIDMILLRSVDSAVLLWVMNCVNVKKSGHRDRV